MLKRHISKRKEKIENISSLFLESSQQNNIYPMEISSKKATIVLYFRNHILILKKILRKYFQKNSSYLKRNLR